jgi:hypothetical protein
MRIRVIAALLAAFATASLAYAQAGGAPQGKRVVQDKAAVSRGASAQDPNVKTRRPASQDAAPRPAPPNKGGKPPATRGVAVCTVRVDNWTGYSIDIYVDRDYSGTVSPWGEGATYAIAGGTRLYGDTVLNNGQTFTWGPRNVDCPANDVFTWRLNP